MKNSLIISFAIFLASLFSPNFLAAGQSKFGGDPLFHFVITEKKLWIVGDEFPVKNLDVKITDETGKVVLEKVFCTKSERWFLDLTNLPEGKYKVTAGNLQAEWVKKSGLHF